MDSAWDELALSTKGKVNVARVDCTSDDAKQICYLLDVKAYPSLLLF
jgi:hypothetical protein